MLPKDLLLFTYVADNKGNLVFLAPSARGTSLLALPSFPLPLNHKLRLECILVDKNPQATQATPWSDNINVHRRRVTVVVKDKQNVDAIRYVHTTESGEQGAVALPFYTAVTEAQPLEGLGIEYFFALLATNLSGGAWAEAPAAIHQDDDIDNLSNQLADLFDRELRYAPRNDEWQTGRTRFVDQIKFFVSRSLPLHFALPAFPCKSSNNIDKTLGTLPDMGELLALQNLNSFNEKVRDVYAPGSTIVIVSDGHVFSDLIGVGDDTVDEYGHVLREQAAACFPPTSFDFHGLGDLLTIKHSHSTRATPTQLRHLLPSLPSAPLLTTPLSSHRCPQADDARRALDALFGSDNNNNNNNWKSRLASDAATTALYRGFSKFLLTDLAHRVELAGMSNTQRKKRCCALAFEMIKRNEAYSQMVELLFPMHLRISIHPHSCAGPKMGVRLIRTQASSSSVGRKSALTEALFHIPTPWHNTVLETSAGVYVLCKKVDIFAQAVSVAERRIEGAGGLFLVRFPDGRPSHYRVEALKETQEQGSEDVNFMIQR
ncbi:dityrosine synthesis enzyme [Geranomyces variabilis]|uniref:Dityrosine synthesis enzyme n=1 Tax=Geranomyces variabilis TaxID=109894 RepID=A0AAD5XJR6_9FUNG|nr:dityrosine synthesis enzyme [Geranomyces variabilis]